MSVIVRFPPSPTGGLHIGSARTALFNYLFARQQGGKIFLRLEDTDRERSKPEHEKNIVDSLKWLGLDFDNQEIWHQSERGAVYQSALKKLVDSGAAYLSKEEVKKEGDRAEVVRFKNPKTKITFTDLIRGEISFDTTDLGDFVIAKSLDEPLYHLAVVVDDLEMGVTHVIRGEDHISNTPRQMLIIQALGGQVPHYAHIPLILAPDRSKMSKRHGAVAVSQYQANGYLPAAIINFIATLGWSPQAAGLEQEILSLADLIKYFKLEQVQKGGAIFNQEKLDWFNAEYLKRLPAEELLVEVKKHFPNRDEETLKKLLPEISTRIKNFADLNEQSGRGEWDYFFDTPEQLTKEQLKNPETLAKTIRLLEILADAEFSAEKIKTVIWDYATEEGRGKVLWPMRVALSGRERSADPFTIASVIGKAETLKRLNNAAKI